MLRRFIRWWAARQKARGRFNVINRPDDSKPYLVRVYLIRTKYLGIFYHQILRSDVEGLHDHPWPFAAWVMDGGYREHFLDGTFIDRKRGSWGFRSARDAHRIEILDGPVELTGPAETLFIRGKRQRYWGFLPLGTEWTWTPASSNWLIAERSGT